MFIRSSRATAPELGSWPGRRGRLQVPLTILDPKAGPSGDRSILCARGAKGKTRKDRDSLLFILFPTKLFFFNCLFCQACYASCMGARVVGGFASASAILGTWRKRTSGLWWEAARPLGKSRQEGILGGPAQDPRNKTASVQSTRKSVSSSELPPPSRKSPAQPKAWECGLCLTLVSRCANTASRPTWVISGRLLKLPDLQLQQTGTVTIVTSPEQLRKRPKGRLAHDERKI